MIYAILVCDDKWKIHKVLQSTPELPLKENECLTQQIREPERLPNQDKRQAAGVFTFPAQGLRLTLVFCRQAEYVLVLAMCMECETDFEEFVKAYAEYESWIPEHLPVSGGNEHDQIQLMSDHLASAKRALMKSNQHMHQLLQEIHNANDTIAMLEQDELTGLYSFHAFCRRVQRRLDAAPQKEFDLMVMQLEHFALAIDVLGRRDCEHLLRELAMFMTGLNANGKGLFARAAGDSFYIFMPSKDRFYDILSEELPAFFEAYKLPVHLFVKIGVYSTGGSAVKVEQMCNRARIALDGLDCQSDVKVVFYNDALHEKLLEEHRILDGVPGALQNREFVLYLQPKYDMISGSVVGAEALIRWIHPQLGFIPPDRFIPLMEREGLIYQVDQYIWEETCKFLHERHVNGMPLFPVSINLARGDFYQKDLLDVLHGLLDRYELKPQELNLEIIERAYVDDPENINNILTNLRSSGFVIEMDDFGVGASSLSMAVDMPVDVLKIDRSFLTENAKNPRRAAVIRFIVDLAKSLQMDTIAEGVETQEQADLLVSLGCRHAQGYLYGRPVPAEKFEELYG